MRKDYYGTLGVPRNAGEEEIKKAYRRVAMECHPDRNPGREAWANERFKEVNEAFSVLGDPDKRKKYDRFGTAEGVGDIFSSPFTRRTFEDLMKDLGGAGLGLGFLDEVFGDLFKGGRMSFRQPGATGRRRDAGGGIDLGEFLRKFQQGRETVRYELILSAEEARTGTSKVLPRKGRRLEVRIPPRVTTGSTVKLSGALQLTDGCPGDILVQIRVRNESGN